MTLFSRTRGVTAQTTYEKYGRYVQLCVPLSLTPLRLLVGEEPVGFGPGLGLSLGLGLGLRLSLSLGLCFGLGIVLVLVLLYS